MNKYLPLLLLFAPLNASAETVSLTLREYQDLALHGNHELREAGLSAGGAEQAAKGAFTNYFPKVSASGGIANTDILPGLTQPIGLLPQTGQSNGASLAMLSATQPLFAGGRIVNGNRLAKVGLTAAQEQLRAKKNEVLSESEKKYRQLQVLDGKMKTLLAYEKMMDSLYSQVSEATERGIATKTDSLRVKLKKQEIAIKKEQLKKIIEIAKKDLKIYAGIKMNADIQLKEEEESVEQPAYSTETLRAQLAARPEYKLLETGVEAARLQKKMKLGSYLPSLAVGAGLYRADYYANNNFTNSASYRDTVAFGMISIPLSDWWEASHSIKEMQLKEDAAHERLTALGEYLLLDMENKLQVFETSYEQFLLSQVGIEQAQTNKSELEDGYKNGTEKLYNYLEALALESESQNKLLEAKSEYFQARTAFLLAIGKLEERKN